MDKIYVRLHRIYTLVRDVLVEPLINYNPIGIRLRTILQEEEQVLAKALQVTRQKPSDVHKLREFISIIYRSDEVAQPTVRGHEHLYGCGLELGMNFNWF